MKNGTRRFLYVFEYADRADAKPSERKDFLWAEVRARMERADASARFSAARGLFVAYNSGGTGFRRVANFLWMHLAAPFEILFSRADCVFVRTTPPMMQISYVFWGWVFGRKTAVWLMDYHPVFGERTAKEGSLMRKIWGVFSWFDRFAVGKTRLFVCLDDAMRELVEKRFKGAKTLISPTFPAAECDFFDLAKKTPSGPIKFLYSGNLGEAHPTENFEILLKKLSARTRTHLSYCGRMEHSRARLEALAARAGAEFEAHAFIKNYSDMGKFYAENAFDYGVVILDEKFKGVVSPSKFSGYSSFGLPILYLGPRGTNASLLCGKFGAGVEAADAAEIDACVEKLLNPETQPKCAAATKGSVEYFSARAAEGVAAALLRL